MAENNSSKEKLNYIEVVEKVFKDHDWNYNSKDNGNKKIFGLPFGAKNMPSIRLFMTVASYGDVKLNCYLAHEVAQEKRPAMIETLNKLNSRYRYITLSLDSDGDLLAQYDFTLFGDAETVDKQVITTIFLVKDIMDECYPDIMKTIWQ